MTTITYTVGDATRPKGIAATKMIAHICNDAGGWGAGFVVALSKRWKLPEMAYRKAFRTLRSENPEGTPVLGDVQFVDIPREYTVGEGRIIVANMIAQTGWGTRNGPPIRYDALGTCLMKVAHRAVTERAVVHMPRIGTGLAGGTWDKIEPLIEGSLSLWGVDVVVYDLPARK